MDRGASARISACQPVETRDEATGPSRSKVRLVLAMLLDDQVR